MNSARKIAADLPYLRRYARSLTGDQIRGDAYVRATLQALLDGDLELEERDTPKVALYMAFHQMWDRTGATLEQTPRSTLASDQTLQRLSPPDRKAFLLTAMEGFTLDEAAEILAMSPLEVARDIASAHADIDAALKTRVLIIEDEPIIALDIEGLVRELGHDVIAVARTRSEATAAAAEEAPGLILADIQLADDSSGIDAVKDILGHESIPVIFITAFPERLLSGDRPEPTYLITKPFKPETVKAVIGQALFFHG
ncbi:MAG: response regulator [Alphaproteobacteria bacterium PA2]|nr:MAG: response regulator [Alphaproteobacteria bacterium PA2]